MLSTVDLMPDFNLPKTGPRSCVVRASLPTYLPDSFVVPMFVQTRSSMISRHRSKSPLLPDAGTNVPNVARETFRCESVSPRTPALGRVDSSQHGTLGRGPRSETQFVSAPC